MQPAQKKDSLTKGQYTYYYNKRATQESEQYKVNVIGAHLEKIKLGKQNRKCQDYYEGLCNQLLQSLDKYFKKNEEGSGYKKVRNRSKYPPNHSQIIKELKSGTFCGPDPRVSYESQRDYSKERNEGGVIKKHHFPAPKRDQKRSDSSQRKLSSKKKQCSPKMKDSSRKKKQSSEKIVQNSYIPQDKVERKKVPSEVIIIRESEPQRQYEEQYFMNHQNNDQPLLHLSPSMSHVRISNDQDIQNLMLFDLQGQDQQFNLSHPQVYVEYNQIQEKPKQTLGFFDYYQSGLQGSHQTNKEQEHEDKNQKKIVPGMRIVGQREKDEQIEEEANGQSDNHQNDSGAQEHKLKRGKQTYSYQQRRQPYKTKRIQKQKIKWPTDIQKKWNNRSPQEKEKQKRKLRDTISAGQSNQISEEESWQPQKNKGSRPNRLLVQNQKKSAKKNRKQEEAMENDHKCQHKSKEGQKCKHKNCHDGPRQSFRQDQDPEEDI